MVFPWVAFLKERGGNVGDLEFLAVKEFDGKLIHTVSSEFTGNADQITYTPASGKTFYVLRCKLYPVTNTIATTAPTTSTGDTTTNRRCDVEITLDGTVIDVLTHDMESINGVWTGSGSTRNAEGSAGQAGQYESNIVESMDGDAVKAVKLTSTNTSGTYRVSLLGLLEDTGTSPKL